MRNAAQADAQSLDQRFLVHIQNAAPSKHGGFVSTWWDEQGGLHTNNVEPRLGGFATTAE